MSRAWCEHGKHYPELIIASAGELDPDGIGVLQNGDGTATNRWADGTAGVPDEVNDEAQTDDEPTCVDHPGVYLTWDHSDN